MPSAAARDFGINRGRVGVVMSHNLTVVLAAAARV
jgi:hypothetical protein